MQILLVIFLSLLHAGCTSYLVVSGGEVKYDKVQEVKTDVLTISRDLALLEERLLYPSGTQLSVFVEMPAAEAFRLDAVRIEIDRCPEAMQSEVATWRSQYPRSAAFIDQLYGELR